MNRPCFLVVDREHANSISTRKLVIETAKMNVITAYSAAEAVSTLKRFPAVSGVVMDAHLEGVSCAELVRQLKAISPKLIVVAISAGRPHDCGEADHVLESFAPAQLLSLLQTIEPASSQAIQLEDERLDDLDVEKLGEAPR